MNCPQCLSPLNDTQAAFCAKCGSRLPLPVARPVIPVAAQMPSPGAGRLPPPAAASNRLVAGDDGWSVVEAPRRRSLKIVAAALVGAVVLAWVMGVTLYLGALPGEINFYVDHEIATQVRGQSGGYADILNQTLNQIFIATWGWAFFGLVLGAGAGWYLTRPKTR